MKISNMYGDTNGVYLRKEDLITQQHPSDSIAVKTNSPPSCFLQTFSAV